MLTAKSIGANIIRTPNLDDSGTMTEECVY